MPLCFVVHSLSPEFCIPEIPRYVVITILKVWFELEMMVRNGGDSYPTTWGIPKFRERRKEPEC